MKWDIDKKVKADIENITIVPVWDFQIFGLGVLFWKNFEFTFDICETSPYAPDGDVPLIFAKIGWVEFIFENKRIYKYVYKKRYGYELDI